MPAVIMGGRPRMLVLGLLLGTLTADVLLLGGIYLTRI